MKIVFAIFCSFILINACPQDMAADLDKTASTFYYNKNFDSAIKYYCQLKALVNQEPKHKRRYTEAHINNNLATSYLWLGDTSTAETFLLENVASDSARFGYSHVNQHFESFFTLAKINYARTQYRTSLKYLEKAGLIITSALEYSYVKKEWMPATSFLFRRELDELRLQAAYGKALCYEQLNERDSILQELAPFMGTAADPGAVRLFVRTLHKVHGKEKVKEELLKGLAQAVYTPRYSTDDRYKESVFFTAECYIPLFDYKLPLPVEPFSILLENGNIPSYLKKRNADPKL